MVIQVTRTDNGRDNMGKKYDIHIALAAASACNTFFEFCWTFKA